MISSKPQHTASGQLPPSDTGISHCQHRGSWRLELTRALARWFRFEPVNGFGWDVKWGTQGIVERLDTLLSTI